MATFLTRSELADRAGIGPETLRYYERRDLLPRPRRTQSGYRQYDAEDMKRVRFIKRAQELGFSLEEIRELMALRLDGDATTADVRELSREKIRDIESRMQDLARMKRELERLVDACSGLAPAAECSILHALDSDR